LKRKLGPFVFEEKPALILSDVLEAMYASFMEKHLGVRQKICRHVG
jgi:hypothetical protein